MAATSGGFQEEPGVLIPLATPFVCVAWFGGRKVKIKMETVSDPEYLSHESYIDGYVRVARKRRVFGALKGSVAGLAGGIAAWLIVGDDGSTE